MKPVETTPNKQLSTDLSQCSDETLIEYLLGRHAQPAQIISVLIERHYRWVWRLCLGRLRNPDDADDATQEILLRAYRGLSGFSCQSRFVYWLKTIAINHCNTFAVRRSRQQLSGHLEELICLHEQSRLERDENADNHDGELILRALERVTPKAREVLQLRFMQDLSLEEIARRLNIGLSAAKARLYRALEQLKARYLLESGKFETAAAE